MEYKRYIGMSSPLRSKKFLIPTTVHSQGSLCSTRLWTSLRVGDIPASIFASPLRDVSRTAQSVSRIFESEMEQRREKSFLPLVSSVGCGRSFDEIVKILTP